MVFEPPPRKQGGAIPCPFEGWGWGEEIPGFSVFATPSGIANRKALAGNVVGLKSNFGNKNSGRRRGDRRSGLFWKHYKGCFEVVGSIF